MWRSLRISGILACLPGASNRHVNNRSHGDTSADNHVHAHDLDDLSGDDSGMMVPKGKWCE